MSAFPRLAVVRSRVARVRPRSILLPQRVEERVTVLNRHGSVRRASA